MNNKKTIFIVGGIIAVTVIGFILYKKYSKPKGGENVRMSDENSSPELTEVSVDKSEEKDLTPESKQSNTITFVK